MSAARPHVSGIGRPESKPGRTPIDTLGRRPNAWWRTWHRAYRVTLAPYGRPGKTDDPWSPPIVNVTLTTTGRKSGMARSVPLYAFEDGDNLVIVGSWAGRPTDPAWAENLRAEASATIRIGREERRVRAREVDVPSAERDRLWTLVTEAFRYYATYQRKTTRVIPLFVLEPLSDE